MKQEVKIGQTDYTVLILVRDSSTGAPKTALTFESAGIDVCYTRVETDNDVVLTAGAPVTTTLTGAHVDWGFVKVDDTNAPGLYKLDIADGVFATGAWSAVVSFICTGCDPVHIEFGLIAFDKTDGVRLGLTSLHNAIPGAENGAPYVAAGGVKIAQTVDLTAAQSVGVSSIANDAITAASIAADASTELNATVLSAISGIGSGTGAALNFAPEDDNTTGDILTIPFVGVETSGTFASVAADNGVYHQIDDATNEIDIIYQFDVGAGRNCAKVVFTGYMGTGTGDTCNIQAYDFVTPAWETRSVLVGQSGTTDKVQDITLLAKHTGTGANAGKVYIRFDSTATNQVLYVDSLIAQAQNLGTTVGYSDGAIWIGGANTGTTPYVDGTADNPVTYAAAKTLSAAIGLTRFRVKNNTSITLDASAAGQSFIGDNWDLALGGQGIAKAYFYGANVTGVATGADAWFDHCVIGTTTIPQAFFELCLFTGTLTTVTGGNYSIINGLDGIPGETNPILVLTANTALGLRNWAGGINLNAMAATNIVVIDGAGKLILDSNCVAGEIRLRGGFAITDNVVDGFLGTLTQTERFSTTTLATATNLAAAKTVVDNISTAVITNAAGTDIAADIIALKTVADATATSASEANAHAHAIDLQTAKLAFTVANQVDANIQSVNDTPLTGDGSVATPWGPA